MALKATEHLFTGLTTPYTSYDPAKTNLGKWIQQKSGTGIYDNYAGPSPLVISRPQEVNTAYNVGCPSIIDWSTTVSWVFFLDVGTASATRRASLWRLNKSNQTLSWIGSITMTPPPSTNHSGRGLAVARHTYSTGTVSASGTAVTGSGTAWQTNRYAVGGRIGFGSTDPTAITTWYHISAIGSDTSITLVENAGTVAGGTSFVIEELRIYFSTTNATVANGGLFVAKGVNYDDFTFAGTVIAAATTTDNIKAVYWLADATTVLNTVAVGLAADTTQSDTSHFLWIMNQDATTTPRIYKYDGRVSLAGLASGKSTSAFVHRTGQGATTTGTITATGGNGIMVTAAHGPGSGAKSMYWVTGSRIYRSVESAITNGSTTFVTDSLSETPTGGTNTFAATSTLTQVSYDSITDRFVATHSSLAQSYVTAYSNSTTTPLDHIMFIGTYQIDQSLAASSECPPIPHANANTVYVVCSDGIAYKVRSVGTSAAQIYIWPLSGHWDYANGGGTASKQQRLITPSMSTTGCQEFYRVYVNSQKSIGSAILGHPTEPFRVYYRTSGINDDSGSWTAVNANGLLTSVTAASAIQFMIEFKTIGRTCLMPKLFSVCVVYEDDSTDSHYEPSIRNSDVTNNRFAWKFARPFGETVPTLIVRISDDVTGGVIANDTTVAQAAGTFEKSTNGGSSWSAYNTTDKANDTTYIRYTVTGTVNGVKARAVLQQYGSQSTGSGTPAGSNVKDIVFGTASTGDRQNMLLETDVGSANALGNFLTSAGTNQDALVHELKQLPVPIRLPRKVR